MQEQASYAPDLHGGFFAPTPYFGFHNTYRYDSEQVSLEQYVIVRPEGTRIHAVWMRYYSPATLTAELAGCGFDVVEVLGDVAGRGYDATAPHFAVIAAPAGVSG